MKTKSITIVAAMSCCGAFAKTELITVAGAGSPVYAKDAASLAAQAGKFTNAKVFIENPSGALEAIRNSRAETLVVYISGEGARSTEESFVRMAGAPMTLSQAAEAMQKSRAKSKMIVLDVGFFPLISKAESGLEARFWEEAPNGKSQNWNGKPFFSEDRDFAVLSAASMGRPVFQSAKGSNLLDALFGAAQPIIRDGFNWLTRALTPPRRARNAVNEVFRNVDRAREQLESVIAAYQHLRDATNGAQLPDIDMAPILGELLGTNQTTSPAHPVPVPELQPSAVAVSNLIDNTGGFQTSVFPESGSSITLSIEPKAISFEVGKQVTLNLEVKRPGYVFVVNHDSEGRVGLLSLMNSDGFDSTVDSLLAASRFAAPTTLMVGGGAFTTKDVGLETVSAWYVPDEARAREFASKWVAQHPTVFADLLNFKPKLLLPPNAAPAPSTESAEVMFAVLPVPGQRL